MVELNFYISNIEKEGTEIACAPVPQDLKVPADPYVESKLSDHSVV